MLASHQVDSVAFELDNKPAWFVAKGVPIGATFIGKDYTVLMTSASPAEPFGRQAEAFIGGKCFEQFRKSSEACPGCPGAMAMRTGRPASVESETVREDGSRLPIRVWAFPMKTPDGQLIGFVELVEDLGERKRVEQELDHNHERLEDLIKERSEKLLEAQRQVMQGEKLASVGRLAAGIAHEINTPIQYVGDNLHAIARSLKDLEAVVAKYRQIVYQAAEQHDAAHLASTAQSIEQQHDIAFVLEDTPKAIEQALEGVQRVAQIVRAMKDFSHVKSGASVGVDINHCLESTLTVARNEYKYHADLRTDFGNLPPVDCYPSELNQVFLNLVINAAHAIQETGRRGLITVSTRTDGDWVEIAIADTGTGIPEQIRDKVYDPFFTTKEVGKGTGQGLFIARQIVVEKHAGKLDFETEVGKGTTFRIRIPATLPPADAAEEETADGQNAHPVRG